jgi:SAM-dependent methyltransferase
MTKKILRKILPSWLGAARRNCGGFNRDTTLFAGYLSEEDAGEDLWIRRLNALIFANGVRKSTRLHRNAPILKELLGNGTLQWEKPSIRVLDIGASAGLDALSNLQALQQHQTVDRYVLGDLYTELLWDKRSNRVFDQDGKVVQQLLDNRFINLNFEFKYAIEPLFHLLNMANTRRWKQRLAGARPHPECAVTIPLVYPSVAANPLFTCQRVDVFGPMTEEYDLVICMNLLQRRYFSVKQIEQGNRNLLRSLTPGGILLTGVSDTWRVMTKNER